MPNHETILRNKKIANRKLIYYMFCEVVTPTFTSCYYYGIHVLMLMVKNSYKVVVQHLHTYLASDHPWDPA